MTALQASDVVFTADDNSRNIEGRNVRQISGTVVFGDGTKTYPANGVPLPVPASGVPGMGLARNLARLFLLDDNNGGDGLIYKWDATHKTIRIYNPTNQTASSGARSGAELGAVAVASATTIKVRCEGI